MKYDVHVLYNTVTLDNWINQGIIKESFFMHYDWGYHIRSGVINYNKAQRDSW